MSEFRFDSEKHRVFRHYLSLKALNGTSEAFIFRKIDKQ